MKRIDDKWLVRVFVLALILVAVAVILMDLAKLLDVVVGLLIVGLAAAWILALLRRKETVRSLPGIVALALFWSAGLVALFAWRDTPPSSHAAEPAGFVANGTGRIVFSDRRIIYAINADGTGQTPLTGDEHGGYLPAWSPGGDRLAFVSDGEIYVMNADGTDPTRLTNSLAASNSCPLWSPDGQRIAFLSDRSGTWDAYVMNADGSHQIRLTHNYQSRWCTPAWSPDGQRLAFVVRPSDGSREIYLVDADGTAPIRLARDAWYPLKNAWRAAWSPDGRQLAFLGQDGIYVMDADGTNRTRLSDLGGSSACTNPVWSPDGQRIAFLADLNGSNIYVMGADGTGVTRITAYESYPQPGHATIQDFVWSPDSRQIVYDAGVPWGLNVMDRDGTNRIHLGSGHNPGWAP